MKYEEFNEDYGCNEFANDFEETSGRYAALQSLLLGEDLDEDEIKSIREFDIIKKFLDAPMGDKCESSLKKLFSFAVIVAKNKGLLAFDLPDSSISIASLIDEGLTRLKIDYKTGTGNLDVVEAADALIDSLVVRVVSVADKIIDEGVPVIMDKFCRTIVKAYPQTNAFVSFIKMTEPYVNEGTKILVRKGINIAIKSSKTIVHKAVSTGIKTAAKIKQWLKA